MEAIPAVGSSAGEARLLRRDFISAQAVDYLERTAAGTDFSGVVSGFDREGWGYVGCFGYRCRELELKPDPDTLFGIASGTKTFTAAAIFTLIADGELSLDDYLFDVIGPLDGIDPLTQIHHLLTHTSGVYDYYDEEQVVDFEHFQTSIPWQLLTTPTDYLPLFRGQRPKFSPGARVSYSNGGFILLGCCIEQVTGSLYRDAVCDLVLSPSGMERSGFHAFGELPENTAMGYCSGESGWELNSDRLPLRGGGDGGMYASARELRSFWQALADGVFLPRCLLEAMTAPRQSFGSRSSLRYGCGVYLQSFGSSEVWGLSGCDAGVGCESWYQPETGRGWSVLSNVTDGAAGILPAAPDLFHSQTEREERNHLDGSIAERVPGSQG